MSTFEKIIKMTDEMQQEMVAQRRDFHKHAEMGWLEMRTTSIIARKLTELGYEVLVGEQVCNRDERMGVPDEAVLEREYERAVAQGADPEFVKYTRGGMTGAIGILRCGEGPTVGMRFDIDALGLFEAKDEDHRPAREGFASINEGVMHACGHDGHATIGLGVAKVLMAIKDQLHGTIKLIFQPAEEGVRGAKAIVDKGHLDDVDYLLISHVSNRGKRPQDIIPGTYGALATCKYDVVFHGKASHAGSSPHVGNNALLAAANAVMNLYAIPRHGSGATRINVGTLVAGSGRNVIADEAKMQIEVRGDTTELNDYMRAHTEDVLEGAAKMYGCTYDIRLMGSSINLHSDEELAERVRKVCTEKLGLTCTETLMVRSTGSEDSSYMMQRVQQNGGQACFFRPITEICGTSHNRRYDFGEELLGNAVKTFAGMALDILG